MKFGNRINYKDKAKGMLVGLAIGDMMGAPLEFMLPEEVEGITEPTSGGQLHWPLGAYTDDTSMALCLADSLLECGGYDSYNVMEKYRLWRDTGYRSSVKGVCIDVGGQVERSIEQYIASKGALVGLDVERTEQAGNGALMRLAPAVIPFLKSTGAKGIKELRRLAQVSARETHYSETAELSAEVFAVLLHRASRCKDKGKVIQLKNVRRNKFDHMYNKICLAKHFDERKIRKLANHGYVMDSFKIAIWGFMTTDSFAEGLLKVVNLGGDADTNGAIYGQLAGAFYGYKAIPKRWRKVLRDERNVAKLAVRLLGVKNCRVVHTRFEEDYKSLQ